MAQSFLSSVSRAVRQALPVIALLFFTQSLVNYYFSRKTEAVATVSPHVGPLKFDVDFDCAENIPVTMTPIKTDWGTVECSTGGGTISSLVYHGTKDDAFSPIYVVSPGAARENACFLVACDARTPYNYTLVEKRSLPEKTIVQYQAQNEFVALEKTFVIYHYLNKIDLTVKVTPQAEFFSQESTLRIVYPSPDLIQVESCDNDNGREKYIQGRESRASGGLVGREDSKRVEKIAYDSINKSQQWALPTLFGADNRYFVSAMVHDAHNFAARAYYKLEGQNQLCSFLESKNITQPEQWTLSFYIGPKEELSIKAVDPRLESTLAYAGLLAPICKIVLFLLKLLYRFLHSYGLAIIILTILMKLALLPFTWRSEHYIKQNEEIQKKLAYLKQRHKNDPQTLAAQQAELFQKHGMPGLKNFLPFLIQIPVFGALWRVLGGALELYHVSWLWIPDLSAKDPYYILPTVLCLGMLVQRLIPGAAVVDARQNFFGIAMACILGAVTASFPAGIALYTATNILLGIVQTQLIRFFKVV